MSQEPKLQENEVPNFQPLHGKGHGVGSPFCSEVLSPRPNDLLVLISFFHKKNPCYVLDGKEALFGVWWLRMLELSAKI